MKPLLLNYEGFTVLTSAWTIRSGMSQHEDYSVVTFLNEEESGKVILRLALSRVLELLNHVPGLYVDLRAYIRG